LEQVVKDNNDKLVQKLEGSIHRASTQNKLLQLENKGLLASLDTKNKRAKRGRRLPLGGKQKQPTDAVFYSPRKLQEAWDKRARKDAEILVDEARKANTKKLQEAKKVLSEKLRQEAQEKRERDKRVKEKEKADKAAERERQKQETNRQKALQLSKKGKRKATKAPASKSIKKQHLNPRGGRTDGVGVQVVPLAAPAKTSSRGRNITLPSKFR
jgi:flagellar biosynthesis GTPase FlhF